VIIIAQKISILGSTGSIGIQALDVARNLNIKVEGITANNNFEILIKQAIEFLPSHVAIGDKRFVEPLKRELKGYNIKVLGGLDGIKHIASLDRVDTVVNAIVGIAGLIPTMEAINCKKNVAIANKETLVTAGALVMSNAAKNDVEILPIDSEHAAVFQCLAGNRKSNVDRVILTASGGPFRGKSRSEMENVTLEEALKHPNWSMGSKITIDSATLMNKGLEVIEAKWLFGLKPEKISVIIHPQSIIHSMVEYVDGSIMAQLGAPDMRIPIQLALTWPDRKNNNFTKLDLLKMDSLTFCEPDFDAFPCLKLAYKALDTGGTMPVVLNAANEEAVSMFLRRKIKFIDIPDIIEKVMERHNVSDATELEQIFEADRWARETVFGLK